MPIRAAIEATNLMVAPVNVGADRGEKSGAVTSVWCMMNTLKQLSWFGEIDKRSEQSCCPAGGYLSDLSANVRSRRDTRLSVMLRFGVTPRHAGQL
jgi:hypothetical protein